MSQLTKPDFQGSSDRGQVRAVNEDQFLIAELSKTLLVHQTTLAIDDSTRLTGRRAGFVFLVADGLGGAPEGKRASRLAVDSIIRSVLGSLPWFLRAGDREGELEEELKRLLEKCELMIQADVAENPSYRGMATTLTLAYVTWPHLYVVHAGDARAYLLREPELIQITRDHTLPVPLDLAGSPPGPVRKVLWNVIGGEIPEVWPEVYKVDLRGEDILLLSTDGLSRHVRDEEIRLILKNANSSQAACQELIAAANREGGKDNITVVVARFGSQGMPSTTAHVSEAVAEPEETT
jgi:protein phosphatase